MSKILFVPQEEFFGRDQLEKIHDYFSDAWGAKLLGSVSEVVTHLESYDGIDVVVIDVNCHLTEKRHSHAEIFDCAAQASGANRVVQAVSAVRKQIQGKAFPAFYVHCSHDLATKEFVPGDVGLLINKNSSPVVCVQVPSVSYS